MRDGCFHGGERRSGVLRLCYLPIPCLSRAPDAAAEVGFGGEATLRATSGECHEAPAQMRESSISSFERSQPIARVGDDVASRAEASTPAGNIRTAPQVSMSNRRNCHGGASH